MTAYAPRSIWRRLMRNWCRLGGHRVYLPSIDRTGFRCGLCHRYVKGRKI